MVTLTSYSSSIVLIPFHCSKQAVYRVMRCFPYQGTFTWIRKPTIWGQGSARIDGEIVRSSHSVRVDGDFLEQDVSRLSPTSSQVEFLVWRKDSTALNSGRSERQVSNSQVVGNIVAYDSCSTIYSSLLGVRNPSDPFPDRSTESGAIGSPVIRRMGKLELNNPYPFANSANVTRDELLSVSRWDWWEWHRNVYINKHTYHTRTEAGEKENRLFIVDEYSSTDARQRPYREECIVHIPVNLDNVLCIAPKRGTTSHDTVYTTLDVEYTRLYLDDGAGEPVSGHTTLSCSVYLGKTVWSGFGELTVPDVSFIRRKTISYCSWDAEAIATALVAMLGDAGGIGINNVENLATFPTGIFHPKSSVRQFLKKCRYTRPLLVLSDIYLMYQYGFKPTFADLKAIVDYWTSGNFSQSLAQQVLYGSWVQENGAMHTIKLRVRLRERALSSVYLRLKQLGLEISAANLWDLVPYSFVVDWVVPIGSWLTALQDYTDLVLNYELIFASVSSTYGEPVSSNYGDLVVKYYDRGYLDSYPVYLPSVGAASGIQVVPGSALVVQSLLR